jgi:hypothetical protein
MNDAYAQAMQVKLCKANTWGVTLRDCSSLIMEFDFLCWGKEPSLHITWTAEKFISSLPLPFDMVDVVSYQRSSLADLTIFPIFPCSQKN